MREKTMKLVITFHTTTQAIAMEAFCQKEQLPGRLIPLPGVVSAGCGLCWCTSPEKEKVLETKMKSKKIEFDQIYHVML